MSYEPLPMLMVDDSVEIMLMLGLGCGLLLVWDGDGLILGMVSDVDVDVMPSKVQPASSYSIPTRRSKQMPSRRPARRTRCPL